jgi:hypothetical protein
MHGTLRSGDRLSRIERYILGDFVRVELTTLALAALTAFAGELIGTHRLLPLLGGFNLIFGIGGRLRRMVDFGLQLGLLILQMLDQ